MAYFERDYIEITREHSIMKVVGIRHEGLEEPDLEKYLRALKRDTALKSIPAFILALLMAGCIYAVYMLLTQTDMSIALSIIMGVVCLAGLIFCLKGGIGLLRDSHRINPEDKLLQQSSVAQALDWKLKTEHQLCEMHDMVSVESAAKGFPVFIGSLVMPQVQQQRMNESALLTQCAKAYVKAQQTAVESVQTTVESIQSAMKSAAAPAGTRVVDLRSDAERAIEKDSGNALQADREQLAQDMAAYLKTHDTGNNMEHYREFRRLFHERSEAIADGGGYHQALQEIYYRIRQLCREQGADFHSGAVDHAFEGEYWQS